MDFCFVSLKSTPLYTMKRSKGRKLGSSRRQIIAENIADQQLETSPKAEEDPMFREIAEKIQSLFSEEGIRSYVYITRDDMEVQLFF